jgi:DNA modification methylase
MKDIPDKSIDLTICDFPYEIASGAGWFAKDRQYIKDIMKSSLSKGFETIILHDLQRVLKKFNAYFFCNKAQLKQYLDFIYEFGYMFDLLTWHKNNPSPLANNKYLSDTEYIFIIRERGVKLNTTYLTGKKFFLTNVKKNDFNHPTVKPVEIIKTLIENNSNEGDLVLDPMCGSGTTCVAAKLLGRNFIGIDISETYCEIARKRLMNTEENLFKIKG